MAHAAPADVPGWDWQVHAACRGLDAEIFFTPDSERGRYKRRREDAAKAVCATCPVAAVCLTWALAAGERHGVWGGLTGAERYALSENHPQELRGS